MKIIVTGGAGFIGSNFIRYMLGQYPTYKLTNIDSLTYAGNLESLLDIANNPNYEFVQADIRNPAAIREAFEESVDAIIHFAAESHVDRSIRDPRAFLMTNVVGTQVMLEAALKYDVKKFVHVSTDEVYGSLAETGYFTETSSLSPNSPYSASKASSDLLVRAYHETFGLNMNITRCSNNYGPFQFPEKLIPLMILNALEGKPLPVYGDGLNVRDWLHVEDHCTAIDLVLHQGVNGEVYNVGGKNEQTNIDVVKTILNFLGKPHDLIEFVQDRLGHDRRYAIDPKKLQDELGWKPKYDFHSGLKRTVNWYVSNSEWCDRVRTGAYREFINSQYPFLGDAQ